MISLLWSITIVSLLATLIISVYGIVAKPNLVKKLIALTIFGDTANVLVVLLGYRVIYPVKPPILPELSKRALGEFVKTAVDPLPQALVITAVVIGMAVNILIAFAVIQIYRIYGTLDVREVGKTLPELLRREEA
ncbi:sodium:proton antiporter [Thermococcus sp.]|uniref:sodium:proton antiporter n=1 Tax=Thermococcus sp. TaxID=35749 RepID=UPI00262BA1BB|nr:sodium:proton antiporter [Thermococcus sp.]